MISQNIKSQYLYIQKILVSLLVPPPRDTNIIIVVFLVSFFGYTKIINEFVHIFFLPFYRLGMLCTFLVSFVLFIFFDTKNNRHRLLPLAGIGVFVLVGFIFSKHRGHVNWTTVASGLATQITIGMLTIRWQVGRSIVQAAGELAEKFFSFAYIGAKVTYGHELIDVYGVFAFKVSAYCIIFYYVAI